MPTYYQTNKTSDLTPFTAFNLELKEAVGIDDSLVITLLAGLGTSGGFILVDNLPNSDQWEGDGSTTTWTLKIQVDSTESNIGTKVRAVRLSSVGAVLQSGDWTGEASMAEDRIFTIDTPDWTDGEEACDNRLAVEVNFINNDASNSRTCTIGLGTSANSLATDITEDAGSCSPVDPPPIAPSGEKTMTAWTAEEKFLSDEGHIFTYNGTVDLADTEDTGDSAALSNNIPDLSRAFVILSVMGDYRSGSMVTPSLIHDGGDTKVRATRYDEADAKSGALTVGYWVVETRSKDFKVQSTEITASAGTDQVTDSISSVDTTKAFIITHGRVNGGYTREREAYFAAEFTNIGSDNKSSTAAYTRRNNAGSSIKEATVHRQVVEFDVKTGVVVHMLDEFDCSGDLSSGKQDVHSKGISTGRTWIYPTFRHNTNNMEALSLRVEMVDTDTIEYERFTTSNSYVSFARTYLVVFPTGVSVKHRLGVTALASDTTFNQTINAVTIGQTLVFHTNSCAGTGQGMPRNKWRNELTTTTNVLLTRNANPSQKSQFGVQAIDFSGWGRTNTGTEKVIS